LLNGVLGTYLCDLVTDILNVVKHLLSTERLFISSERLKFILTNGVEKGLN
jgi:hypothetical protein